MNSSLLSLLYGEVGGASTSQRLLLLHPILIPINWLWEHKHKWTALCDATLITPPTSYQAILHSVPISFTPTNRATIAELCRENTINPIAVESTCWLGHSEENNQSHGSIVLNLKDKDLASKIVKGFLFHNGLALNGAPYKKSLTQCFQCLKVGHAAPYCKNPPLCKHCGDNHNSNECPSDTSTEECVNCIKNEKKRIH
ncbi:hypothetical protein PSTG_01199 [Puccinia striiformis f. sp. tritici PST-78]|uniref:CCHC-type domain-containing protein n=1 Tax=Puccinia striiformis f. sp. tritici PST-78 TaxID=1165861 RepID=A0A0L0W2V6_9BASI|nr:hypothetical protein PSTG_01199 [Puccinia striiformis f. sp. tritici PST-78]